MPQKRIVTATYSGVSPDEIDYFPALSAAVHQQFLSTGNKQLFTTYSEDLFSFFLANLPGDQKQHHNCSDCRKFITTYGGLVTIDETGTTTPAMWPEELFTAYPVYREAIRSLHLIVKNRPITGVFYSSENVYGTALSGGWEHLSVRPHRDRVYSSRIQTAEQAMAEKKEEYRLLHDAMLRYTFPQLNQVVVLLKSDSLYRSEKCLGVAEFLLETKTKYVALPKAGNFKGNFLWTVAASAPPGFCHPKSSMVGTLLDDLEQGLSFDEVAKRFATKMHPLQYQRPQAPPSLGNIEQAEKLVEKLGIAKSLERRFARLEEVPKLWEEQELKRHKQKPITGIFSSLKPPAEPTAQPLRLPSKTLTWVKFLNTELSTIAKLRWGMIPGRRYGFSALVTATNPDAPGIFQWNNTFSWYLYQNGSFPKEWNLGNEYGRLEEIAVKAIVASPPHWDGITSHHAESVTLILDDCKDLRYRSSGLGLFPEILKAELHGVRATIEAYSRKGTITGAEQSNACGLMLRKGGVWDCILEAVHTNGNISSYLLDRWD